MRRITIVALLIPLFVFGFYQYCIKKVGSTLQHVDHGYWGAHDAEFDWCERNYRWSPYCAEFWNVTTSLLYTAAAIALWRANADIIHADASTVPEGGCLGAMLLALGATGIGSAAFHATLRYDMQLLDELPMLAIGIAAACVLRARGDLATRARGAGSGGGSNCSDRERAANQRKHIVFLVSWWAVTVVVLCFTTREWLVHRVVRMAGTLSMCAALIYCFLSIQQLAAEVGADDLAECALYPPLRELRQITARIAAAVALEAARIGLAPSLSPEQAAERVEETMWNPEYLPYVRTSQA